MTEFLYTDEWQTYRDACIQSLIDCYLEIATLKPENPGFVTRYAYLQGYVESLYRQLRAIQVKLSGATKTEDIRKWEIRDLIIDGLKGAIDERR